MSKDITPNYLVNSTRLTQLIKEHVANIKQHSLSCLWEVSMRCPCVSVSSNSPKPNCPVCHGQGYFFPQSYTLDMAFQGDEKAPVYSSTISNLAPSTIATPQFGTVSGVPSQNIKPGDRITIPQWTTPQDYIFNLTKQRIANGLFLPYKVVKILNAYTVEEDGSLQELDIDTSLKLEHNVLQVLDDTLKDKTISCLFSIEKRFYVESLLKELRYENFFTGSEKSWATSNGNTNVYYDQLLDGKPQYNGVQTFEMPNKLSLRRELFYINNINLITKETDNNMVISDPVNSAFNDWRAGE